MCVCICMYLCVTDTQLNQFQVNRRICYENHVEEYISMYFPFVSYKRSDQCPDGQEKSKIYHVRPSEKNSDIRTLLSECSTRIRAVGHYCPNVRIEIGQPDNSVRVSEFYSDNSVRLCEF